MTRDVRILIVDDSETDAKLVGRTLRVAIPNAVIEHVDREDALRGALVTERWDAVVSDWSMPGFTGQRVLELVRATGHDIPFVIISGSIGEEVAVDAMRAGANDYVLKQNLARLAPAIERELREAAERAAHAREQARFRALIEKSSEGIVLTTADGIISYASPAAARILGRPVDELVGMLGLEMTHPDDRGRLAAAVASLRPGDAELAMEWRVVRPDGEVRWVATTRTDLVADPAVNANVVNLRDITDRRRASEALRASEARFARLAESGIIGVLTADLHGRVFEVNAAYANMVGYTRDELLSGAIRWIDLIPPDLAEATQKSVAELLERGAARPFESAVIHKTGRRVPVLAGVAALDYPMSIAFSIDLTEWKQAEEALHKTELHLRQAQKMEAVGRLAGGIAHDFNNILAVILSYTEMILADQPDDSAIRGDLEEVVYAGRRAADLTRQLLMFSRRQVIEPRVLDLGELLGGMDKMLRRLVGEDVELATIRGPALGAVRADPSSIEQVIMNLVVNARDAMPTGGKLTLETANVLLDEDYVRTHNAGPAGPHVMLAVTDTGVGMDAAVQARIFEPFFTTKPVDKGTGLGLSTVFGIVQQINGSIAVYSEVGLGTTFKIYVPCIASEGITLQTGRVAIIGGSETVLLVEDEAQVRAVARGILRRHGYHVLEARDPRDAIQTCERYDGEIHLLLTDVVMPAMSGAELARQLAQQRPTMRVLCMSGYTDDSIVRHGILREEVAFLQKPFTPESLARKVREVLDSERA
jgi:PAS domain S-box-containing protein